MTVLIELFECKQYLSEALYCISKILFFQPQHFFSENMSDQNNGNPAKKQKLEMGEGKFF